MNAEQETLNPSPPQTNTTGQPQVPPVLLKYRRNSNVARLPKAVRDKINLMLEDGLPYAAIIEGLGPDGEGLCISNVSDWKDGG